MRLVNVTGDVVTDRHGNPLTYPDGFEEFECPSCHASGARILKQTPWTVRRAVLHALDVEIKPERLEPKDRVEFSESGRKTLRQRSGLADRIQAATGPVELSAEEEALIVRLVYAAFPMPLSDIVARIIEKPSET